jgi:uncharacterized membrane protein YebE (DUF533 family)
MEAEAFVSASRLYMLRAVIALAHTDGVLELDEVEFLNDIVKNEPLAPGQREMLVRDLAEPQDAKRMFSQISCPEDRDSFFRLAAHISDNADNQGGNKKILIELARSVQGEDSASGVGLNGAGGWLSGLMQHQSG